MEGWKERLEAGVEPGIEDYIERSHDIARRKGWWDEYIENSDNRQFKTHFILSRLMLIVTEISEACEEVRDGRMDIRYQAEDGKIFDFQAYVYGNATPLRKPIGLPIELADALIRVFDLCGGLAVPLKRALLEKLEYNEHRKHRHGGRLA